MALYTYYLDPAGGVKQGLDREAISAALESKEGLLWVDVEAIAREDAEFLAEVFQFHPLALEDCLSREARPPKVDDFGDYLFMVVHGVDHTSVSEIVETTELDIFLGPNYVVSSHSIPILAVAAVRAQTERDTRLLQRGTGFLTYALIDAVVSNVIPTIDKMTEVADLVEEEALSLPQQSTLETILKLKRSTRRIDRAMTPQREVLNRLGRREFEIIQPESEVYLRHAHDRVVRVQDLNNSLGDRADQAMATYLSAVAIRQNDTMKSLAIVASVFLPLTLLAGIWGMNFENMPELELSWGYYGVLGVMVLAIFGTMSWFWIRNWINWGRRQVSRARLFAVDPELLITPLTSVLRWRRP